MPTNKPGLIESKPTLTKADLQKTKILRGFGVKQLQKYQLKLKQNIKVFQDAIQKERIELDRTKDMIKALKFDIKQVDKLKKLIK